MTTTNATAAKRAIIDRLKAEADSGVLSGVDVDYAFNGNVGLRSIYAGGWRMTAQDAVAEGPGLLVAEQVTVSLYVRVVARPATDVEETDAEADRIETVIGRIFRHEPQLAGGFTVLGIPSGQGDYSRTDDETVSVHALQVRVESHLAWG